MWIDLKNILLCFTVLHIFGHIVQIESKAVSKNGKKKVFGAGLLAGGLAGAAVGPILSRNDKPNDVHHDHHHQIVETNSGDSNINIAKPMPLLSKKIITIERGETMPNGCFKQTIREPNENDTTLFIETEQLICPQNLTKQTEQTYLHITPLISFEQSQDLKPGIHIIQVPVQINPIVPKDKNDITFALAPSPEPVYTAPLQQMNMDENNTASVFVPTQPIAVEPVKTVIPSTATTTGPAQVIILSRKTVPYEEEKSKKNAAQQLFSNTFNILLSSFVALILCKI